MEAVGGNGGSGTTGGSGVKGNLAVSGTATVTATGKYGYGSQSPAITGTITAAGYAIMGSDDENNINNTITSGTASSYAYVIVILPTAVEYASDAASGTDYVLDDTVSPNTLHIKTAKGAAWWSANGGSFLYYNIYLDNDIDISDFMWSPVGSFAGTFDGQGHSIAGLTADGSNNVGLFSYTIGATIQNLCLASGRVSGVTSSSTDLHVGGVVAFAQNTTICNCCIHAAISGENNALYGTVYVGGIVGVAYSANSGTTSIANCYSTGTITVSGDATTEKYAGGVAGSANVQSSIINCYYLESCVTGATAGGQSGTSLSEAQMKAASGETSALIDSLNGWVSTAASTEYYTWAAGDGYPVFGPAAQTITKAAAANGSFTVKVNGNQVPSAREGQTVTVTPTADTNYELDTITVTKTGDASMTVTVTSGSFTMPAYPVTVTVSFKAVTAPSNPGGGSDSPSVYPITEGAESEWTQGTDGSLRFRSTGSFSSFHSVSVDNGVIRQNVDYATAEGSTYITLKPEYLSTLAPGVHTMRITFTGGYSVTTFTIAEKTAWGNPFGDVNGDDWFFEDVRYVHENELMQGTGDRTFSPHMDTSRGMIVTILWRMENQPGAANTMTFTDVPESKYYHDAVEWAAENKIVEGYDELTFGPDYPITREQMAAILYRYAKYKGYDVTATADLSMFADADKIGTWATSAVSWANANELITGKGGGILDPQGKADRCRVAAIRHRFCENVK